MIYDILSNKEVMLSLSHRQRSYFISLAKYEASVLELNPKKRKVHQVALSSELAAQRIDSYFLSISNGFLVFQREDPLGPDLQQFLHYNILDSRTRCKAIFFSVYGYERGAHEGDVLENPAVKRLDRSHGPMQR